MFVEIASRMFAPNLAMEDGAAVYIREWTLGTASTSSTGPNGRKATQSSVHAFRCVGEQLKHLAVACRRTPYPVPSLSLVLPSSGIYCDVAESSSAFGAGSELAQWAQFRGVAARRARSPQGFVDGNNRNFSFSTASPAHPMGTRPLDVDDAGPRTKA